MPIINLFTPTKIPRSGGVSHPKDHKKLKYVRRLNNNELESVKVVTKFEFRH
jgi:hypothetical protein